MGAGGPARPSNSYGRFDLETGKVETLLRRSDARAAGMQLRAARLGASRAMATWSASRRTTREMRSELVIADAQRLGEGDIARVILPFRISQQVHGVWADAKELALG